MPKRKSPSRSQPAVAEFSQAEAKRRLDSFLAKYSPEIEAFARRALAKMRKLVPGAIEMVYDNFNWLVIGFGPSERPLDAIFSLVLPPSAVTLCFLQGAGCPIRRDCCAEAAMWCETSGCTPVGSKMRTFSKIPKCSA